MTTAVATAHTRTADTSPAADAAEAPSRSAPLRRSDQYACHTTRWLTERGTPSPKIRSTDTAGKETQAWKLKAQHERANWGDKRLANF